MPKSGERSGSMFRSEPTAAAIGSGAIAAACGAAAWGIEMMVETVVDTMTTVYAAAATPLGVGVAAVSSVGILYASDKVGDKIEEVKRRPYNDRGFLGIFFT